MNYKKVVKILKKFGFEEKRQTGSHLILKNYQNNRMVVVPVHNSDLKKGLFLFIIKQSGIPKENFFK